MYDSTFYFLDSKIKADFFYQLQLKRNIIIKVKSYKNKFLRTRISNNGKLIGVMSR